MNFSGTYVPIFLIPLHFYSPRVQPMAAYACHIAVPAHNYPKYRSLHSIPLRLPLPLSHRRHRTFQGPLIR